MNNIGTKAMTVLDSGEYAALCESYSWNPEPGSAKKRLFLDVDGVIMPEDVSEETLKKTGFSNTQVMIADVVYGGPTGTVATLTPALFYYQQAITDRLSRLSQRDDVDVVWLTMWNVSAPLGLDEALGIRSVGYLPWHQKLSSYQQSGKGAAILKAQSQSPTPFVWVDDIANKVSRNSSKAHYFEATGNGGSRIEQDSYLSVTPDGRVGLTSEHLDSIEEFLDSH